MGGMGEDTEAMEKKKYNKIFEQMQQAVKR